MKTKLEGISIIDSVEFVIKDKNGNVKASGCEKDLLTKAGLAAMAGLLIDVGSVDPFTYVAIGIGTTPADVGDPILENEIKRKVGTLSRVTTQVGYTNDTAQLVVTFSSADGLSGVSAVTEIGVLNAGSNGILLMRQVFAVKSLDWDGGDQIIFTVKVQMKQGS